MSNGSIQSLGIYFGHNKTECKRLYWEQKIVSITKTLQSWQKRNLTVFGKITIIKTLIIPRLAYNALVILVPEWVDKKVNAILYSCIWDNKREQIKRTTMIGNYIYDQGGVKCVI